MSGIIFCGYGKLGRDSLATLLKNEKEIKYVLTHRDLSEKSVDKLCIDRQIEFSYKDSRVENELFLEKIKNMNLDYIISVNYRYIIPKSLFELSKIASFNIHGSLLPKYRGRTPHVWSIINGEKKAGITSHIIEEIVDSGDIIKQIEIRIENDDTGAILLKKYEKRYPDLLLDSLEILESKKVLVKQDKDKATYFGKRDSNMGYIDFYKSSNSIINFVRAQAEPYPGAYYYLSNGKKIIVNKTVVSDEKIKMEEIGVIKKVDGEYFVKCLDAILILKNYRVE